MNQTPPELHRGAVGPAVFALREHLRAFGHRFGGERDFGERTEQAVRAFQAERGLRADGICGPETWAALHDAGFALGDRILALRSPMVRGDDVAALQHRLSALGFDPGRPDGIFGPNTQGALRDFQRNAGIADDGVCGPGTITALDRLDALAGGSVVVVRERERLATQARTTSGRRVALNGPGAARELFDRLADHLNRAGAEVLQLIGEDDAASARAANDYGADLFVALRQPESAAHLASYFGTPTFRSVGGHHHASALAAHIQRVVPATSERIAICARTYTVLKQTRMAAVVIHLADEDYRDSVEHVADVLCSGIRSGFEADPVDLPPNQTP